jgi:hypothetical protein
LHFHGKENQKDLASIIDKVVFPRKGKLPSEAAAIEKEPEFVKLRQNILLWNRQSMHWRIMVWTFVRITAFPDSIGMSVWQYRPETFKLLAKPYR